MASLEFSFPLDFWANRIIYKVDIIDYVIENDLFNFKDSDLFLANVYNKFKYQKGVTFEKRQLWYLIKFFFISSIFYKLDHVDFYGGVPSKLKILCDCGDSLDANFNLKGYFSLSKACIHEYYLRISKPCPNCNNIICIYRNKEGILSSLMIFLNFLDTTRRYLILDDDILFSWKEIMHSAFEKQFNSKLDLFINDLEAFAKLIPLDNPKFLNSINKYTIKNKK